MADLKNDNGSKVTWFVGAAYGGTDDQLPRFLKEGIWESGREDKHLDVVRSMRPGERIAVKSSYTRKRDLPFDAGAVLNGFIRDAAGIEALGFPTFCRGVYAQDQASRGKVIDFRTPIEIEGVRIAPGDLMFGGAQVARAGRH